MFSEKHPTHLCPARFSFTRYTFSIRAGVDGTERIVIWAYIPDIYKQAPASPSIVMANGLGEFQN